MADLALNVTLSARNRSTRVIKRALDHYKGIDRLSRKIAISSRSIENSWKNIPRQAQRATSAVKRTTRETKRQTREVTRQLRTSKRLTLEEAKRSETSRRHNREIRKQAKEALGFNRRGVRGDPDAAATNLGFAGGALQRAGQGLGRVNKAAIGGSITTFASFEEVMADVAAKGGTELLDQQRELARQLGRDTRFSAEQAGQGLVFLAQSGLDAQQRLDTLPSVLNAATATSTDLAVAASELTDVMVGYGLAATEAAHVSDVLTSVSNNSNQSFVDLTQGMSKVGPVLKAMGADLKEGAVLMGLLADAGFRGSEGGTKLRMALLKLNAPRGRRANRGLNALGVGRKFRAANISDPQAIFRQLGVGLDKKTQGLSEEKAREKKLRLLTDIVGPRAIAPVLGLIDQITKGRFEEKFAIEELGAAQKGADEKTKTLTASTERLKNTFGDVGIELGQVLAPDIKKLADSLSDDLLPVVKDLIKENPTLAKGLAIGSLGAQGALTVGGGILNVGSGLFGITGFMQQLQASGGMVGVVGERVGGAANMLGTGSKWALGIAFAATAGFTIGTAIDKWTGASDVMADWMFENFGKTGADDLTKDPFRQGSSLEQARQRLATLEQGGPGTAAQIANALVQFQTVGQVDLREQDKRNITDARLEVRRLETGGKGLDQRTQEGFARGLGAVTGQGGQSTVKIEIVDRGGNARVIELDAGDGPDLEMDLGAR